MPPDITSAAAIEFVVFGLVGAWIGSFRPTGPIFGLIGGVFLALASLVILLVARAIRG